ncbi:MAG: DUF2088 domain-containing protein, partial [Gemmatimonadetes bacterium]|nr:DUF2088 domain-containing protein [Gemmatimonadota bacterium]
MKVKLDYGRAGLEIEVPNSAEVLQMTPSEGLDCIEERIAHGLARPIGTPSLRRLARGRKNACIVIADITRPVPNAVILPPMLRILEEEGIAREDITLLVGTGLHRPNEGEELVQLVG